jgi:hypothetical protein
VACSGMDANFVTAVLFENYLGFIDDDAIDDVACASANFSDAAHMIRRHAGLRSGVLPSPAALACIDVGLQLCKRLQQKTPLLRHISFKSLLLGGYNGPQRCRHSVDRW